MFHASSTILKNGKTAASSNYAAGVDPIMAQMNAVAGNNGPAPCNMSAYEVELFEDEHFRRARISSRSLISYRCALDESCCFVECCQTSGKLQLLLVLYVSYFLYLTLQHIPAARVHDHDVLLLRGDPHVATHAADSDRPMST